MNKQEFIDKVYDEMNAHNAECDKRALKAEKEYEREAKKGNTEFKKALKKAGLLKRIEAGENVTRDDEFIKLRREFDNSDLGKHVRSFSKKVYDIRRERFNTIYEYIESMGFKSIGDYFKSLEETV